MNYIKFILLLVLSVSFLTQSQAQKDIRKADKQLELRAYDLAIKNYKSHLDQNPDNTYAQLQLAEAYRRTNALIKSVFWYEKAIDVGSTEMDIVLNYANSLKKLGLYEKAQNIYSAISDIDASLSNIHLSGCEAAIELLKADDKYDVNPFDGNSENSDFGAVAYGEQIIFSSFRTDLKRQNEKKNLSYIKNYGNQLFIAPNKETIDISELGFLRSDFKEVKGIGPVSYSKDGKKVAYTKNNLTDGAISVEDDDNNFSIFLATVGEEGDFSDDIPLPFNEIDYSYAFPHLAFNGSALYFSSNKEGGHGGFDIYVSYFKNGTWNTPENLGPKINSSNNEITPFLNNDLLYFSTDNVNGLGGYDIYLSQVTNGNWSDPENLGKGINSPGDDYYLNLDSDGNFLFSSNRLGGRGKDDIYTAIKTISLADEIFAQNIPPVTNLDGLVAAKTEIISDDLPTTELVTNVSDSEAKITRVNASVDMFGEDNEFKLYDHFELSLKGAIKKGDNPTQERFFIQIASLKKSKGQIGDFSNISSYGKLYRFVMDRSTKIRLGSFDNKIAADMILEKVKRQGYRDAFITKATLSEANIELLNGEGFVDYYTNSGETSGPQYKVRLASYSDETWFDVNELQFLDGELEQWTKGYWHIFILSGFESIKEAEAAQIKAINRGFTEAEVVIDDRGVLKKLNKQ